MDTFRFLTKTPDSPIVLASVVGHENLDAARNKLNNRFASNEEVVAVDVWDGKKWKVLQGVAVDADAISRHTLTPIGVAFEGSSETDTETQATVEQPQKLDYACGYYNALESEQASPAHIKINQRQPLIVQLMGYFTVLLAVVGVFMAYEFSGDQWGTAMNAGIWVGAFIPAFLFGIGTYAMKYVVSIQQSLFRMELATQQNG